MKKVDIRIIIFLLIIVALVFLVTNNNDSTLSANSLRVEVYFDGELFDTGKLSENKDIVVNTNLGMNMISILDGRVGMVESDCNDLICVKSGWIDSVGESIVCLPHKVYVKIVGEEEVDIDALSQ